MSRFTVMQFVKDKAFGMFKSRVLDQMRVCDVPSRLTAIGVEVPVFLSGLFPATDTRLVMQLSLGQIVPMLNGMDKGTALQSISAFGLDRSPLIQFLFDSLPEGDDIGLTKIEDIVVDLYEHFKNRGSAGLTIDQLVEHPVVTTCPHCAKQYTMRSGTKLAIANLLTASAV